MPMTDPALCCLTGHEKGTAVCRPLSRALVVDVLGTYREVCDSLERLVEDHIERGGR
jgi:hypothetical protein